jgi:hypothetical protein
MQYAVHFPFAAQFIVHVWTPFQISEHPTTSFQLKRDVMAQGATEAGRSRSGASLPWAAQAEAVQFDYFILSVVFPPTVVFDLRLQAGRGAPFDRKWHSMKPRSSPMEKIFGGDNESSSYEIENGHDRKGNALYYNSEFAGTLWRR